MFGVPLSIFQDVGREVENLRALWDRRVFLDSSRRPSRPSSPKESSSTRFPRSRAAGCKSTGSSNPRDRSDGRGRLPRRAREARGWRGGLSVPKPLWGERDGRARSARGGWGGLSVPKRDATRDPSSRVPPHEHAAALAHAARDPRAGLSRGRSDLFGCGRQAAMCTLRHDDRRALPFRFPSHGSRRHVSCRGSQTSAGFRRRS